MTDSPLGPLTRGVLKLSLSADEAVESLDQLASALTVGEFAQVLQSMELLHKHHESIERAAVSDELDKMSEGW